MQRLRIRFSRGEEIKYISHLDLMRLWQRALNRAGVALAYSSGFNPHPRLSLAAPLALGVTSEAELMDIYLSRWISPHVFTTSVGRQLPPGIAVNGIQNIDTTLPSLQSQVHYAEYKVGLETKKSRVEIESSLQTLLAREHLPWEHQRDTGPHRYDLRVLIEDLWLIAFGKDLCELGMRLNCDNTGTGRPEQVAAALDFEKYPESVHRVRLIMKAN